LVYAGPDLPATWLIHNITTHQDPTQTIRLTKNFASSFPTLKQFKRNITSVREIVWLDVFNYGLQKKLTISFDADE
jgi:hypothetical protein